VIGFLIALCACAAAIAAGGAGAAAAAAPAPGARAAALIEESTGQQLYGLDADAQLPIASTTKLMTALVTLHHSRLSQVFPDPNYYPAAADSQIGLVPGERMSVHDLLIAMLLPSADDAAEDLAFNVGGGSVARFLGMMNARARELDLRHTHYTTPIGLDTPGNYSSAGDLVHLARFLLETEPFFKRVVATRSAVLRSGNLVRHVTNLNDLVGRIPWVNGVKTGHTLDAGYVLVASGTQHGMTLIDAVLGTSSEAARDAAALSLLNYGFATYTLRTPLRAGTVMATLPVRGGKPGARAKLLAASTYTHVFRRSSRVRIHVQAPAYLAGPLPTDAAVGTAVILDGGRPVARVPLELASALPLIRHTHFDPVLLVVSVTLSGLLIAAGAVVGLAMFWRHWTRG
jgi:serine-type D-Ala-D-Ala carboxypeptidase (penicillin-binding protein 5/6)